MVYIKFRFLNFGGSFLSRICPLFSSSKGNSTYVGTDKVGVLIDVGRSAKQIEKSLYDNDISTDSIKAIFITHEHYDHVQGLKVFASRHKIKVFASGGTISALEQKGILSNNFLASVISSSGVEVCGMHIKPFETPHDSRQSVGYIIDTPDNKRAVIATDIGYITDKIRQASVGADVILIESNHDIKMLQNGKYPYYLKRRILSNSGHLSNEACADELPNFVKNGTDKFILAHLSQENNIPELAYESSICKLASRKMVVGMDFQLVVAPVANVGRVNVNF